MTTVTEAERLEADVRKAMAETPAATWRTRESREFHLALVDALLDAWLDETRGVMSWA